jgi:hypothetical protein
VQRDRSTKHLPASADYYSRSKGSIPGADGREPIPFAIPYNTAHSGNEFGIVDGSKNRNEIQPLIKMALDTRNVAQWRARRQSFEAVTAATLEVARGATLGGLFGDLKGWTRQAQYDAHSQIIVRLFDQDGRPITDYDIYFGTAPDPPLFAANRFLGSGTPTAPTLSFTLPTLTAGATYYWKIVGKTAANLSRTGPIWSFTTAGAPPPPPEGAETVVIWTANVPSGSVVGDWIRITDAAAAGGAALQNPDRTRAKVAPALISPANYFEATFTALSGVP